MSPPSGWPPLRASVYQLAATIAARALPAAAQTCSIRRRCVRASSLGSPAPPVTRAVGSSAARPVLGCPLTVRPERHRGRRRLGGVHRSVARPAGPAAPVGEHRRKGRQRRSTGGHDRRHVHGARYRPHQFCLALLSPHDQVPGPAESHRSAAQSAPVGVPGDAQPRPARRLGAHPQPVAVAAQRYAGGRLVERVCRSPAGRQNRYRMRPVPVRRSGCDRHPPLHCLAVPAGLVAERGHRHTFRHRCGQFPHRHAPPGSHSAYQLAPNVAAAAGVASVGPIRRKPHVEPSADDE